MAINSLNRAASEVNSSSLQPSSLVSEARIANRVPLRFVTAHHHTPLPVFGRNRMVLGVIGIYERSRRPALLCDLLTLVFGQPLRPAGTGTKSKCDNNSQRDHFVDRFDNVISSPKPVGRPYKARKPTAAPRMRKISTRLLRLNLPPSTDFVNAKPPVWRSPPKLSQIEAKHDGIGPMPSCLGPLDSADLPKRRPFS